MILGIESWYVVSIKTGEIISYVSSGFLGAYSHLKARLLAKRMNKLAGADVFKEYSKVI